MKKLATLLALVAMVGMANASDFTQVGYTAEPGEVIGGGLDECTGTLVYNHDYTFETGYAWQYGGVEPPYYGAFGEGFAQDAAAIECVALWLTDVGYYMGGPCDVYVWEGGVSGMPGAVLTVMTGVDPGAPALWPSISQHDVDIPDYSFAGGELTVGYWGDWAGMVTQWYCAADLDGFGGNPWTNLAPGSAYGTGWMDPSVVSSWGTTMSMGLGYYYWMCAPAESATWGSIKALF